MKLFTKSRRGERSGMSIVEMLVGMAIGSLVMTAILSLSFYTSRSVAALSNYTELDQFSRNALDRITSMVRQSDALLSYSPTELRFQVFLTNTLVYTYNPSTLRLTEQFGNQTRTLLRGCDFLKFEVYQRTPVAGTYDQFPAALTNDTAKLVQVTWICSREIMGHKANTESVQSAKIVIRN